MPAQIYLASRSPRRAEFLAQLGVRYAVLLADVPEQPVPGQSPLAYALATAIAKAPAAAALAPRPLPVLGADTDVSIDGVILGKPQNRDEALAMLLRLSERTHEVCSAVAVIHGERIETVTTMTRVRFGLIPPVQAAAYCAGGEPLDKAGAYAIQGGAARWVRSIDGSYTGVVGLPLYETAELLAHFGVVAEASYALRLPAREK